MNLAWVVFAKSEVNLAYVWEKASIEARIIIIILLIFSIFAWSIMATKAVEMRRARRLNQYFDAEVQAQKQAVDQQVQRTESGKSHWQQQRMKLKAFDTLSDRHFASETARELKRDQKAQDEFAARRKED